MASHTYATRRSENRQRTEMVHDRNLTPLQIHDGDWFKTFHSLYNARGGPRPQCFEYAFPPRVAWGLPADEVKINLQPLPLSTYIGPVHGSAEHFRGYVTVCVPSFWQPDRLCWVNVRKDHIAFAQKVPTNEVRQWSLNGWNNDIRMNKYR